ncbi:MAG: hypothetical protein B7Z66_08175 [Chromatiales bacterium 21-64-14]|nr:MAG: hypothetical protein B7Z66_08175 [Chromatiales bacterium 21-64-14]HQU15313.1 cytochrome P450 [Gammaproteobacteria bacterium]
MPASPILLPAPPGPDEPFDLDLPEGSLDQLLAWFHTYGDIYRLRSPRIPAPIYVVNHPDDVKRILVNQHRHYVKGIGIERVKILLGNGIMVSEGEFWRRQRTLIQPAFHRRVVTGLEETVWAANRDLLHRWSLAARNGEPVNVTRDTSDLALQIVLCSLFGTDLPAIAAAVGGNPFAILTQEPSRDLRFAARFRSLGRLVLDCAQRRRAEGREHFDLLAMLMAARDRETGAAMTDKELLDEVMTLIVAGHETTASTLNWTWYLLSRNPGAEQRLHAELGAQGDAQTPTAAATGAAVSYARQVLEEALRLYPPGWLLTRRAVAEDRIGDYPVALGTHVFISPYLVHRHPRFWEEPEAFRPERFAPAAATARHRYAHLPFGAGPRQCVGQLFAMMEMEIHLRTIAQALQLRRADDTPVILEPQVNLRTRDDLLMIPALRTH